MYCRFEDRIKGTALELQEPVKLIQARCQDDLHEAFDAIRQAQQQGFWVGLALDYELAELWEPHIKPRVQDAGKAVLNALVFKRAQAVPLWHSDQPISLSAQAQTTQARHYEQLQSIQRGIKAGDFYQINYSLPIQLRTPTRSRDLYAALATRHPVAYACYFEFEQRYLLSLSPELFVHQQARQIRMRPMKGTRPRHADPEQDRQAAQDLASSDKDRAENLMIVDLLRNDLGRLAVAGSVRVTSLFNLEKYASVWTMTSEIEALLRPDVQLRELVQALFPCGSITGAPKLAAMQAIRELEQHRRGIYCGALGYLAPHDELQLNVAIRTAELNEQGAGYFGAGGGIVADSQAHDEWLECLWKARVLNTPIRSGES